MLCNERRGQSLPLARLTRAQPGTVATGAVATGFEEAYNGMGVIGGPEHHALGLDEAPQAPGTVEFRALAAESAMRRRIAENLHDGIQQRLVVLLVGLSGLVELIDDSAPRAIGLVKRLEHEAQEAIQELRDVVSGLQPPVLTAFGLVQALRDISRSFPTPVSLISHGVRRYDPAVEDAVFFICREALQNTIKHAPQATIVTMTLIDDGHRLDFGVEDNGPGFDAALPGGGFATMNQRIEALGGSLAIESAPGVGSSVHGSITVSPRH